MDRRMVAVLLAVLVGLSATAPFVGTVQADSHTVLDDVLETDGEGPGFMEYVAYAMGLSDRYNPAGRPEKATADVYAENTMETFNNRSDSLRLWVNGRANVTEEWDVIRVKFTDESGNSEWMFIVSNVNTSTGDIESTRAMNLTAFKDTGREYDKTYSLDPFASRHADEELERFYDRFAEENRDMKKPYLYSMAGKYQNSVSGSVLPGGA